MGHSPALTSLWVAAGPQSNMIFSPSTSRTNAEPNRVGVGVGVPAPSTYSFMCWFRSCLFAALAWRAGRRRGVKIALSGAEKV